MKLIIVESPGKVKKIQDFLGSDFRVVACVGHVRDLPEKEIGVAAPDFKPHYVPTDGGREVLAKLAETVYLATDPDREGEAIAWHLAEALELKDPLRITFSEITETAVKKALANPRRIDQKLVKAQEGRRVLDRLVGYMVSPAISNAAGTRLSAGRVQSPALRLVVEREAAIRDFKSLSHFGAEVTFEAESSWTAQWNSKNWLENGREYFQDREAAEKIAAIKSFTVIAYQESESKQAPPAPFTTSSLQQAASNTLKFSPQETMELAQQLFQNGHITYMRTDSPNLSEEAVADIRALAAQKGWPFPVKPRTRKSRDGAQEAHEAIRPTHLEIEAAGANGDEKALYSLIRLRALASQLDEARYVVTTVILEAELEGKEVIFEAKGRRLIFPGWRVVMDGDQTEDEAEAEPQNFPKPREGEKILAAGGKVLNKKTRPQSRFTEAALVKKLEELGIGRPSTYAAILSKIARWGYVEIDKRQLVPTASGEKLIKLLEGKFSFLNSDFTKELEAQLDDIAEGEAEYRNVVAVAHETLCKELREFTLASGAYLCPECGKALRRLTKAATASKSGYDFWGCTGYPQCQATFKNDNGRPGEKNEPKPKPVSEFKCPKCKKPLYRRQGVSAKTGQPYDFYGCSDRNCNAAYPAKDGQPDFTARKKGGK